MSNVIRPAVVMFLALTLITGVVYPAIVTGIAKGVFASQAEGSLVTRDGRVVGSSLIAQPFTVAKYLWPRPSAAGANGYDATSGSGSNLGPSNSALADAVKARIATLRDADPGNAAPVPVDLVTASGSGLDPHVSVAAARYQVRRIARARGVSEADVERVIDANAERSFLGDAYVNVLGVNLALDRPSTAASTQAETALVTERGRGFAPASN